MNPCAHVTACKCVNVILLLLFEVNQEESLIFTHPMCPSLSPANVTFELNYSFIY